MDEPTVPQSRDASQPRPFGDRWRTVALLGTGGMGSVYLAHDAELGELVALKVVRPQLALSVEMVDRFRDEVRLSRRVSSPYVARTHDLGVHDGRLFLTMQYVEGETLATRLKRNGALPLDEVIRVAHDVGAGLDAVHAAGVVHRDLKPANVLLAKDGRAVITDFGIALSASARGPSDGYGTPLWAAPEQLFGDPVDLRADVYAFGALLFAVATGRKPFESPRTGAEPPPDPRAVDPALPEAFGAIVMRAMAIGPEQRFASAGAVYEALAPLATSGGYDDRGLFAFVRSICRTARNVHVRELARAGVGQELEHAVREHLVSRLVESGDVRTSEAERSEATVTGSISARDDVCELAIEVRSHDDDVFFRETFHAPMASLPNLAERAAVSLARSLATNARPADDAAAFGSEEDARLFLEARAEYKRFLPANVQRCVALLDRILARSPKNPTVLAWKGAALARLRFYTQEPDATRPLVERALALGTREPAAYMALAESALQDMLVTEASGNYVAALRSAPGMDARSGFAFLLSELGAFEPALRLADSIVRADPSDVGRLDISLRAAALRGRFDQVKSVLAGVDWTLPGAPRLQLQAMRYAIWDRDREAFRRVEQLADRGSMDDLTRALLSVLAGVVLDGALPQIEALQSTLAGLSPRRRALSLQIGCELCALLRQDAYFYGALDGAVAAGVFDSPWIDCCPLFDRYRGALHFETARRTIHRRAYDALAEMERRLSDVA